MTAWCAPHSSKPRSDQQIVDECNALARQFYKMQGCEQSADFKFYEATHPAEAGCWNMAALAYDHIEGTEVDECLRELAEPPSC
jgi:hypothetical protein